MGLTSEMKNLSEEILTSFKQRIKENEELVNNVQKTLDGFHKDQQDMAAALRAGFDKGEKARLNEADILMKKMIKDHKEMALVLRASLDEDEKIRMNEFVALMKSINEKISEIFTFTNDLLTKFNQEHKDMAEALRSGLDEGEEVRMKEFVALMKSINEDISEIFSYTHALLEKSETERLQEFAILIKSISTEVLRIFTYTHDMIAKFDKEHQEMSVELRKNLADGEVDRLKEFNVVMTGIQNNVKNLKKAVAELLGDFAQDREGASAAWKKMSEILAQLRKTGVVTSPKEVIKKEAKKKIPAEKVTEAAPVKAEPKPVVPMAKETKTEIPPVKVEKTPVKAEPKPVASMTIEEKILGYVNKHPKGVRVSEMEVPLGENRMKLGFVSKKLLDDGKILKIESTYYPKPKL